MKVNNDFVSRNVYCYCSNCPVNRVDVDGNSWIGDVFEGIVDGIRSVGKNVYNGAKAIGRNFIKGTSMISGWFFGLNTASEFLNNSLQDNPKNLFYGNGSDIVEKIVNSKQFQRKVHSYAIENPNAVLNKEKLSITFEENMDLYLGLHKTTFEMTGVLENGKGKISFTLTDEYDFDDSEDGLIGPINHTAYTWQEQGWLNNYKIILDFDYCVNCE